MRPNRRIVVAMIYWEEMANNVNDQDWYEQKIKQAIKVGFKFSNCSNQEQYQNKY